MRPGTARAAAVRKSQTSLTEEHLFWDCMINGQGLDVGVNICVLIDSSSHADFIREDVVDRLGLHCHQLPQPEVVELAMNAGESPVSISLSQYVKFSVSDPLFRWKSRSIRAVVSPGLCAEALLGLPFLVRNEIVIDHAARSVIPKLSSFNLLAPLPDPVSVPQSIVEKSSLNKQMPLFVEAHARLMAELSIPGEEH